MYTTLRAVACIFCRSARCGERLGYRKQGFGDSGAPFHPHDVWRSSIPARKKHPYILGSMTKVSERPDNHISRTQCPTQAVELHMSCELSNIQGLLETFNQPEDAQVDCGIESLFIRNKSRGKFRLPSPFYVFQFPHLSHIELVSCYVDWGSPMFYNTRLMYLYVSGMEVTNKPSLLDFLGILQN